MKVVSPLLLLLAASMQCCSAWTVPLHVVVSRRPSEVLIFSPVLAGPRLQQRAFVKLGDNEERKLIDSSGAIDVDAEVQGEIGLVLQEELAKLANETPEEQEASLPGLMERVESRALANLEHQGKKGYKFGDITKSVVETTRGEVQRQIDAEWNMDDVGLLLKVGLFLGASAAAPVAGLAALPAAAVIATYGTILKAELGVRAIGEVGTRMTERAAAGIADGVRAYTGKEDYEFGDITKTAVEGITGKDASEYEFGDITKKAVEGMAGKDADEYKFGDITKNAVKKMTGKDADEYKFGDITRNFMKAWKAGDEKTTETQQQPERDGEGNSKQEN